MAPAGAKVWNDDLVDALKNRADQKRQQGSRYYIGYQQAADKIQAIRKDIYTFQNGRIVNLPRTGLSNTMYELCRKVIAGEESVVPPGYVAPQLSAENSGNPFANHHYLKTIKIRGGAFAILMAFRVSPLSTMTKDQIIQIGQPFCGEEMADNFHAGRPYGAWKANKTLKNHGLLHVNSTVQYREGRGLRAQGKFTYELTRDGERFTEALLDRHPEVRQEVELARAQNRHQTAASGASSHVTSGAAAHTQQGWKRATSQSHTSFPSPQTVKRKRLNQHQEKDVQELRAWVESAGVGNQKKFSVGKERRKVLHDECDALNLTLRASGRYLKHESMDHGAKSRHLFVTLLATDASTPGLEHEPLYASLTTPRSNLATLWGSSESEVTASITQSSIFPASGGHRLGGDAPSPPKRARQKAPPPSVAAGEAALRRFQAQQTKPVVQRSLFGSSSIPKQKDADAEDDSFQDSKMPARRSANDVIDLLDTSDSDDDALLNYSPFKNLARKPPPVVSQSIPTSQDDDEEDAVVDLTDSQGTLPKEKQLTIYIDDRERNRNATPRYIRTELQRLVSATFFTAQCHADIQVVEKTLKTGDFAFSQQEESLLSPLLERKQISDLVQRSSRKDHWFQLHRMRDSLPAAGVCIFLLEGDFRTSVQYPSGEQIESFGPDSHTIDSEESLIRFMGRAILSTRKVRFIQTKEIQGSLRAISAIGLVVASRPTPASVRESSSTVARSELASFLKGSGVPCEFASCVADEIGSKKQLEALYASIDDDECRAQVLAPILVGAVQKVALNGSAVGWSRAIYKSFFSVLPHSMLGKQKFDTYRSLVDDHALLLESLHSFVSSDEAVNNVYETAQEMDGTLRRQVTISTPAGQIEWMPVCESNGHSVFVKETHANADEIPCVTMQTKTSAYKSDKLVLFVMNGKELVERLRSEIHDTSDIMACALRVSASIRSNCCSSKQFDQGADSCALIIRGLGPALDAWAKMVGYRSEFRVAVDVVLSDLSISHKTVVLQAVRLNEDLEIILQQLALACFNYQLLTRI